LFFVLALTCCVSYLRPSYQLQPTAAHRRHRLG